MSARRGPMPGEVLPPIRTNPLRNLARSEAVGRVLTKRGRSRPGSWAAPPPIRWLVVAFTNGAWSTRHWPPPFAWNDLSVPHGYRGLAASHAVVRRLDDGAPQSWPVGSARAVDASGFFARGWELEPERVVTIVGVGGRLLVTTNPLRDEERETASGLRDAIRRAAGASEDGLTVRELERTVGAMLAVGGPLPIEEVAGTMVDFGDLVERDRRLRVPSDAQRRDRVHREVW